MKFDTLYGFAMEFTFQSKRYDKSHRVFEVAKGLGMFKGLPKLGIM